MAAGLSALFNFDHSDVPRNFLIASGATLSIGIACGIGDDAAAGVLFADQRRHVRVHGPGQCLLAGGTEFHAGHENHVGRIR